MVSFRGIIPAMLTPFNPEGKVDSLALRDYTRFLIDRGVHGLFPVGTNGEGPALTVGERKEVAEVVVEAAGGRVPVIIQTGAVTTSETVELTCHVRDIGADAAAIVAPYYFPHDEAALEEHFAAIARAVPDFTLFLYNIPANARNDLKPGLVRRLRARFPNITGIKDSSKDLTRLEDYIDTLGDDFTVIVGTDTLILPALVMGGSGVVSAVANVFPEPCVKLYEAYQNGDLEEARRLQYLVNRIRGILKSGPYITPYRYAAKLRGLPLEVTRLPFRGLTEVEREKLERGLRDMGLVG